LSSFVLHWVTMAIKIEGSARVQDIKRRLAAQPAFVHLSLLASGRSLRIFLVGDAQDARRIKTTQNVPLTTVSPFCYRRGTSSHSPSTVEARLSRVVVSLPGPPRRSCHNFSLPSSCKKNQKHFLAMPESNVRFAHVLLVVIRNCLSQAKLP